MPKGAGPSERGTGTADWVCRCHSLTSQSLAPYWLYNVVLRTKKTTKLEREKELIPSPTASVCWHRRCGKMTDKGPWLGQRKEGASLRKCHWWRSSQAALYRDCSDELLPSLAYITATSTPGVGSFVCSSLKLSAILNREGKAWG